MASAFGAGAGADMLQQILRQKAAEVYQQGLLRQQAAELAARTAEAQARQALIERQFQEGVRQYNEGAPLRIAQQSHLTAETDSLNRAPQESATARAARASEVQAGREFTAGENAKNRANAIRIAGIRSDASGSGALVPIKTVDAQGNPVTTYLTKESASGQTFAQPQKAPPRMQPSTAAAIGQADASLHQLDKLEQMFPQVQGKVGPATGRFNDVMQNVPLVPVDKQFASFKAESDTLKNATIKAITGAQMSEPEAKRIMRQIPSETDKPDVWIQKAKATRDNIAFLRNKIANLYGLSSESGNTDASAKAAELLKKYGGG